jgi:hypothetical protein
MYVPSGVEVHSAALPGPEGLNWLVEIGLDHLPLPVGSLINGGYSPKGYVRRDPSLMVTMVRIDFNKSIPANLPGVPISDDKTIYDTFPICLFLTCRD